MATPMAKTTEGRSSSDGMADGALLSTDPCVLRHGASWLSPCSMAGGAGALSGSGAATGRSAAQ